MAMTGRTSGSAPAATDKKYRRGSSTSWSGKRGGARGGGVAAAGRGGFAKGRAAGSRDASTRGLRGGPGAGMRGGRGQKRQLDDDEEWQGIASSPEPAEEVGPEAEPEEDEEEEEVVAAAPPPKKKQRKPTGGTGKKQMVFVESKSDLLALAASVSGDVAKKTQAKVEKAKSKPVKAAPQADRREPSETKQKQLAAARAVVSARNKAKKESSRPVPVEPASVAPATANAKKGVRFA